MKHSGAHANHLNWDDIRLFLTIAEQGSFRKGATILGVGHTTLSRRIESLEEELSTKLFHRISSGLTLTDAGEELFATASPMGQQFAALQTRLFGQDAQPKGRITFTAPRVIVNYMLLESLQTFCDQWPHIHVDIAHATQVSKTQTSQADIAIRLTDAPDEQSIGRQLGFFYEAAYANRSYLNWFNNHAKGIHRWLYPGNNYEFTAQLYPQYQGTQAPQVYLTIPDADAQRRGAELGMGMAILPCLIGDRSPDLVRISEVVERSGIWLLSHKESRNNKRMQLFRDFLVDTFNRHNASIVEANPI